MSSPDDAGGGRAVAGRRGLMLALAAATMSGLAVFVNAYGVRAVPDATVYTTAKNLVAAAVLIALAGLAARGGTRRVAPGPAATPAWSRGRLVGLGAVAVIGGSVPFVLFFEGLARASSSQAAFLHKTMVIWVAVLAIPLLGERLRGLQVAALATLVVGQALLAGGLAGLRLGGGELLVLGATVLWSVEVVLAKRLLRQTPVAVVGIVRMAAGAGLLTIWVAVSGRWSGLTGLGLDGWMWAGITGLILAGYVTLWFSALAAAPAVDVTAVLVLAAVVTGLLNTAVKGAAVTAWSGAGMLIVLLGVALVAAAGRPRALPVRG